MTPTDAIYKGNNMNFADSDDSFVEPFDDLTAKKEEGLHIEKKSSIVFNQKSSEVDLNYQLGFVIMKEIAAFANTEGGYLYIGITDDGRITGVEKDFTYLNTGVLGLSRKFRYQPTWDHFKLIILAVARQRLQPDVDRLIRIKPLHTSSGRLVCRIYVKPCRDHSPMFYHFNGVEHLFRRDEAGVVEYTGEEKYHFIQDWQNHLLYELPPPETDSEDELYFSILTDGTITLRERKLNGQQILKRIKGIPAFGRTRVNGWILIVSSDGTLAFYNPNRLLYEIKNNGGYSSTRVPSPNNIISSFFYRDNAYVLVQITWQHELDGFKCFDPLELFTESKIEATKTVRFLEEDELEIRKCWLVEKDKEYDKFVSTHPYFFVGDHGVSRFYGQFNCASKADFGRLTNNVDPRFFSDLIHLAETGKAPDYRPFSPNSKTLFLNAVVKDWCVYEFSVSEEPLPSMFIQAESNQNAEKWRDYHLLCGRMGRGCMCPPTVPIPKKLHYTENDNLVYLYASSGRIVRSFMLPIVPGAQNEGQTYDIKLPVPLRAVYYCTPDDYLVLLKSVSKEELPIDELPIHSEQNERLVLIQACDIPFERDSDSSEFDEFFKWIGHWDNVITSGILSARRLASKRGSLAEKLSALFCIDPRCPIMGFSPLAWERYKDLVFDVLVASFENSKLVVKPLRERSEYIDYKQLPDSLKWISRFPELSGISITPDKILVPAQKLDSISPMILTQIEICGMVSKRNMEFVESTFMG